ncbi:TadE family protein [Litorivicinus lipolyticus]|uniref:TadE family protein n=1 Tax=Litorivicinus lipolyticus TaxID=418701 RepID=UPI003B5AE220
MKQRGQAMTEFIIIVPAFILLIFGALQIALIYSAKNTLEYATFQAARLGALNHAEYSSIRRGLIRGLAPLYTISDDNRGVSQDIKGGILGGRFSAQAEVDGYARIIRVNPRLVHLNTRRGFGEIDEDGVQFIPNDNLGYRNPAMVDSTTIQDANLLKIVVQYCLPLRVPMVNRLIASLSELNNRVPAQSYHPDETVNDPRFADRNLAEVNRDAQREPAMASYDELCGGRGSDRREQNRQGFVLTTESVVRMQSATRNEDSSPSLDDRHCDGDYMSCL